MFRKCWLWAKKERIFFSYVCCPKHFYKSYINSHWCLPWINYLFNWSWIIKQYDLFDLMWLISNCLSLSMVTGGRVYPSGLQLQVEGAWAQTCCCCSEQLWVIVIAIHAATLWWMRGPERASKPRFLLSFISPSKRKTAAKHLILGVDGGTWGKWCSTL